MISYALIGNSNNFNVGFYSESSGHSVFYFKDMIYTDDDYILIEHSCLNDFCCP